MSQQSDGSSRREFLKASVLAPLAVTTGSLKAPTTAPDKHTSAPQQILPDLGPLPMREVGRSRIKTTILNLGGMMNAHNPRYLDMAWSMGIRCFDTADCYKNGQSEKDIATWIARHPERRGRHLL